MRIGFLGAGWIGRARMKAAMMTGLIEEAIVCEPDAGARADALDSDGRVTSVEDFDALLDRPCDGVVIATPSALHAQQATRALEAGAAVFCQKPVGRTAAEVEAVVETAKARNLLYAADFSYRYTRAMAEVMTVLRREELGRVYFVDLVFHNAYGPDKPWFYDRAQSGGGCMMDLGVHLVDLALTSLGPDEIEVIAADLLQGGGRASAEAAEDFACATLRTGDGAVVRIACSWKMPAGEDAIIACKWFGQQGAVGIHNVDGSFYDFRAERFRGVTRETLAEPPDEWGGRAIEAWLRRLKAENGYCPSAEDYIRVARVLDGIYLSGGLERSTPDRIAKRRNHELFPAFTDNRKEGSAA